MTIKESVILGYPCRYHSTYKGFDLWRDVSGGTPRMHYIAVGFDAKKREMITIEAKNLDGIKGRITKYKETGI